MPSPPELAAIFFRARRDWLPRVFPDGKIDGNKFLIGNPHGKAGRSLSIPFDSQPKLKDFESGWHGDDLDLFGMGYCGTDDPSVSYYEGLVFMGYDPDAKPEGRGPQLKTQPRSEPEEDANPPAPYDEGSEPEPVRAGNGHDHSNFPYEPMATWGSETQRFPYLSAGGEETLFEVVRFEIPGQRKTFHQWIPSEGKWTGGRDGAKLPEPRPLYHLNEIANRPNETVVLVEGEKCADALAELGYLTTTCMGGAQGLGSADIEPLRGRNVIAWRDNDKGGIDWQKSAIKLLTKLECNLRVVKIPGGVPEKWDAADALADEEWPPEAIEALVENAEQPEPEPGAVKPVMPFSWASKAGRAAPEQQWLLDQWIPWRSVTGLFGTGGMGKSFLVQLLSSCCAVRHDFLGIPTRQCKVMAVFCEDDEMQLWLRQERINEHLRIDMHEIDSMFIPVDRLGENSVLQRSGRSEGDVEDGPFLPELLLSLQRIKPELVVLDNIMQVYSGNLSDPVRVARFIGLLSKICREYSTTILLVGHTSKAEGSQFMGTQTWSDALRSRCLFRRADRVGEHDDRAEHERPLVLSRPKTNRSAVQEVDIELHWGRDGVLQRVVPLQTSFSTKLDRGLREGAARQCFLNALDELWGRQHRTLSESRASRDAYAPYLIGSARLNHHAGQTFSMRELHTAMEELLKDGTIKRDVVGQYANRTPRYGLRRP